MWSEREIHNQMGQLLATKLLRGKSIKCTIIITMYLYALFVEVVPTTNTFCAYSFQNYITRDSSELKDLTELY